MKNRYAKSWKVVLAPVVFAFVSTSAPADIVSTEQMVQQSERERVEAFLQRDGVEKELKALGVAPESAKERVKAMTDEEIRTVAGKMDTLAAGGALTTTEWIGIIVVILLLIIIL